MAHGFCGGNGTRISAVGKEWRSLVLMNVGRTDFDGGEGSGGARLSCEEAFG